VASDAGAKDSKPRGAKPPMHLLPVRSLWGIARAFGHGRAKGYERDSWRRAREDWRDAYASAAMRHLCAVMDGEVIDPESGLPHVYHLGATVLILIWHHDEDARDEA